MKLGRSTYAIRRQRSKACSECGLEFFPFTYSQRFCSKSCAAKQPRAKRVDRPGTVRDKNGRLAIEKTCLSCGDPFLVPRGAGGIGRKTCSIACAAELKRSRGGADRRGRANPNFKSGKRVGERDRAGEERWYAVLGDRCMAPSCSAPEDDDQPLCLHHAIYRQHVRREGGDEWDPRNAFTICNRCHTSHHRRGRVLPVSCLPDSVLEFAVGLFGAYAIDHLRRYYEDDGDPRLIALGSAP